MVTILHNGHILEVLKQLKFVGEYKSFSGTKSFCFLLRKILVCIYFSIFLICSRYLSNMREESTYLLTHSGGEKPESSLSVVITRGDYLATNLGLLSHILYRIFLLYLQMILCRRNIKWRATLKEVGSVIPQLVSWENDSIKY